MLNFLKIYLFISGCAGSLLLLRLFSSCGEQGLLSSCTAQASYCSGLSCCRAPALGYVGSSSWQLTGLAALGPKGSS